MQCIEVPPVFVQNFRDSIPSGGRYPEFFSASLAINGKVSREA
jgi:hypothetical protein